MRTMHLPDGKIVTFQAMTSEHLLAGGAGRCPANCLMKLGCDPLPTQVFRDLSERMIARYGTTAILAIEKGAVAGFVSFYPSWCPHHDLCSDEQITAALAQMDALDDQTARNDRALHVRCLIVRPEYRGHGLAHELLLSLKEWARDHGWKRIVGNGCIFSGRAQYQWLVAPKPPRPVWEKAGFSVEADAALDLPAIAGRQSARAAFDWYLSASYPDHLPRDIATDDPDWREIFADHTMVCRL